MVSVAVRGSADRMAARIFRNMLQAGSGMPAKYSSTVLGVLLAFAEDLRLADFFFFTRVSPRGSRKNTFRAQRTLLDTGYSPDCCLLIRHDFAVISHCAHFG